VNLEETIRPAGRQTIWEQSRLETNTGLPLWDHVTVLEKPKPGGGNILWRCNYCPFSKSTSYTRVEAHLLQKLRQGIKTCPNVSFEMLSEMRREMENCKELVERSKARTVSLPVAPSDNSKRTKRGPAASKRTNRFYTHTNNRKPENTSWCKHACTTYTYAMPRMNGL
jgi:hypothetical protein